MREFKLQAGVWVQRQVEFVHRNTFNVEETGNETTVELPHLIEHLPHVVGVLFS